MYIGLMNINRISLFFPRSANLRRKIASIDENGADLPRLVGHPSIKYWSYQYRPKA